MTPTQSQEFWRRVAVPSPERDLFFRLLRFAIFIILFDIILAFFCL